MTMWRLRNCPKCGGDMFIDKDMYGWYEKCLQCAYQHDLRELSEFKKPAAQKAKVPVRVNRARQNN